MIASLEPSTKAAIRRRVSSVILRSVTSRPIADTPTMAPSASLTGDMVSSTKASVPAARMRTLL